MTAARVRVLAAVLMAVAAMVVVRIAFAQLLSPGPLSKSHASLEGDQHCNDCHSSGRRVAQGGCFNCHADVGGRIAAGLGLHGLRYKGKPCESCHAEHLGGGAPVRWPGGDPSKLDHAQTGWPLAGAHQQTACNKCHDKGNARGAHTYLGLPTACASCHKDVHQNRFGASCLNCHDERSWKNVKLDAFNHDIARFALRGAHQTTPCAKCHAEPPKYTGLAFASCTDCHKDVHRGKLGPTCTNCHNENRWKPATLKFGTHPGTSLANGHATVPCRACHDRGNLSAPSRGAQCVSCHKPVHKAPFGRACAGCHASIEWLGLARSIGLSAHEKTAYLLTGNHQSVDCGGCHRSSVPSETRFRGLSFGRCADCHEDAHKGEFARRDRGDCGACHATKGFRATSFGVVAHASTRFPLEGTHSASPCSACHEVQRPMLDLRISDRTCKGCHDNPHGGQFAREMSQGGCGHCHDPNGWHLPKIDHRTWPLTGAHATAECDSCHHPTNADRKSGHGASYRGVPRNCAGCHDDVHLGQFRLTAPRRECGDCHATVAFKIPGFDHEKLAGWALTFAHAKAPCEKCHAKASVSGGESTTRWRLPGSECSVCHANPHRQGSAAPSSSPSAKSFTDAIPCDACHTNQSWQAKGTSTGRQKFDHSTTGFPLTGAHVSTPCAGCHGTNRAIRRDCVGCHEDAHRGRLSQSCDRCHSSASFRQTRPIELHRITRFPLTGMHVLADCTECHRRGSERRWTDAPIACFACHEADYRRPGIFPVHTGTATEQPLPRDCSLCHRAIAWVPALAPTSLATGGVMSALSAAPPNHDLRFPISFGVHRGSACPDCHASPSAPRAVRCIGCHAHDPVRLSAQHRKPVATDGAACMGCHIAGARR